MVNPRGRKQSRSQKVKSVTVINPMKLPKTFIGQKFLYYTVTSEEFRGNRDRSVIVTCKCGTVRTVPVYQLINGNSKSCGCRTVERSRIRATKHGEAVNKSRTYETWARMRQRCNCFTASSYRYYGGRGIKVCERWESYTNFLEDMGERPSDDHSLDRIDNNGNYEPTNCRWATKKEQANNKRSNRLICYQGITRSLAQWEDVTGIKKEYLSRRLIKGWPIDRTLETPVRKCKPRLHID